MFFEIHVLSHGQNFSRFGARDRDHPVRVGDDEVTCVDRHSIADHTDVCARKAIVADRGRRHDAQCENRKTNFLQVGDVAHATINYRSGKISCCHRCSHQSSHASDVNAIFNHHHIHGIRASLIDGGQHAL